MAPFKKKPKLGGRTNKEFRDEHAGSFEERPELGGRTNEGFRSESPQFTPKPELGGRTNEQFRGEQEFASKPQIGDGPARVEDVPQPPQPPQAVGGDAGGASLQELEAKIARLEDLAAQAEAERNIAQAEMDAVESELQGVKDGLGVEFVKNDPSVALYGQTHDGVFVGDPASNNAQEIYAPGGIASPPLPGVGLPGPPGPPGPGPGTGVETCPGGTTFLYGHYFGPYDLYSVTTTTCKIRGSNAIGSNNRLIGLAGVWTAVDAGGGGVDFDTELTPADGNFLYIKVVRGTSQATTLELGGDPGGGFAPTDSAGQAIMYIPLYYFKLDGSSLFCLILDFRRLPRIDMMGN